MNWRWPVLQVTRVVDGDTIDCVIDRGFGDRSHVRFRVGGVDTPELRTPEGDTARRFTEDWTRAKVSAGRLMVQSLKHSAATAGIGDGAFGRWVGYFYDANTDEHLHDALIGAGHVKR